VTAIIFCVAMSEYDQVLHEDETTVSQFCQKTIDKTTSGFSIATYPFPPWTCILAFEIIVGFNFTFYKAFVNVSWHKGFNSVYRQGNHSCLFSRTPKKPVEKRANFGPLGSKTKWF
jgi:hypothetical protein